MTFETMPSFLTSDNLDDLQKAILNIQSKCQTIGLDGSNPFFKSKYATYHQILSIVQPILLEEEVVIQFFVLGGELTTRVTHVSSQQFMQFNQKLALVKKDSQGVGAAITYMKRYTLVAFLNLDVADIDDDGNTASGKVTKELPHLSPSSPNWKKLVTAVAKGTIGIEKIQNSYALNAADNKKFQEQVSAVKTRLSN